MVTCNFAVELEADRHLPFFPDMVLSNDHECI